MYIEKIKKLFSESKLSIIELFIIIILIREMIIENIWVTKRNFSNMDIDSSLIIKRVVYTFSKGLPFYILLLTAIFGLVFLICTFFKKESRKNVRIVITTISLVVVILSNRLLAGAIFYLFRLKSNEIILVVIKAIGYGMIFFDCICARRKASIKDCLLCSGLTTLFILGTRFAVVNMRLREVEPIIDYFIMFWTITIISAVALIGFVQRYHKKNGNYIEPRIKDKDRIKYQMCTLIIMAIGIFLTWAIIKPTRDYQLQQYINSRPYVRGEISVSVEDLRALASESQYLKRWIYWLLIGEDARFIIYCVPLGVIMNLLLLFILKKFSKPNILQITWIYFVATNVCWYLYFFHRDIQKINLIATMTIWPTFIYYLCMTLNQRFIVTKAVSKIKLVASMILIKYINAISWYSPYEGSSDNVTRYCKWWGYPYDVRNDNVILYWGHIWGRNTDGWEEVYCQAYVDPLSIVVIEIIIICIMVILIMFKDEEMDDFLLPLGAVC